MTHGIYSRRQLVGKPFPRRTGGLTFAVFALMLSGLALANDRSDTIVSVATAAERLIDEAGHAKADGNVALAYALLHDAVRIAPDNPQARWQLGQVKVSGEWLSIEEAQRRAAADPRQAKYGEHKDAISDSPQDQLALAQWCRKNNLDDEARVHWAGVLTADPNNKQALRAVGMRWHDNQLLSPTQLKASREESSSLQQSQRHWTKSIAVWMRVLSDKHQSPPTEVIDEIRAIDDIAAIPAFEKVTLNLDLPSTEKNPAPRRLSLAFLGALRDMPNEAATNSLVRHAVLSPFADVRAGAIAELRYRPLSDFVPSLLDRLAAPLESAYRVQTDPDGSVHYLRTVYREGPFADWSYRSSRSIHRPGSPFGVTANISAEPVSSNVISNTVNQPGRAVSAAGAQRSARRYEQEIIAGEQQVEAINQQTTAANERIVAVLRGVSDQSLGNEPRAWWSWWQDYTDYDRSGERPVYETQESSNDYIIPPVEPSGVECFVRGTPVWTKTGRKPIEVLAAGDLVLAQNVNTGEIAYKPVMLRTLRPPGPILQISAGDEKLLATRGHPMWVDGVGWRMAKELDDGAMLHSVTGTTRVAKVQPASEAETYNLVVADFNTYFVGESGILVHDNTPRRPTQAYVPGLTAK